MATAKAGEDGGMDAGNNGGRGGHTRTMVAAGEGSGMYAREDGITFLPLLRAP
uniref:Uncharacterized protein n=1 Tax=Oryza sativa subsp. japonica TaxID=39947 RepID=Q655C2_ORYSJ|nr:hypothetical protein [Oryza sativa Japonica Group]BAD88397.1 hypothetical protein [Oryza sativa Japonica Group]